MALIPLTRGLNAIIDDEDLPFLSGYKWSIQTTPKGQYYAVTRRSYKLLLMHKLLLPYAKMVDHINGDGLDNRKENLRETDPSRNTANNAAKGVHPRGGRWIARITKDGQEYSKHFDSEIEAIEWRKTRIKELYGSQLWRRR